MKDHIKKKIMDTKWATLEKFGLSRPTTVQQNKDRAEDAHSDLNVVKRDREDK